MRNPHVQRPRTAECVPQVVNHRVGLEWAVGVNELVRRETGRDGGPRLIRPWKSIGSVVEDGKAMKGVTRVGWLS